MGLSKGKRTLIGAISIVTLIITNNNSSDSSYKVP